jgi:maltooligosyltrehalose trehalohydrolase
MQKDFPLRSQGASLLADGGVRYRTWVPGRQVSVAITDASGSERREVSLGSEPGGYWSAIDPQGRAGDRYQYRFDGKDWPDPASRFNPDGVHGAAQVIDPRDYVWGDGGWRPPSMAELVIYELHIGTFTAEGTFRAAMEKLDHVAELGATAIEIMPVADFPGKRNWGYDGVSLYAPARVYGTPDDFRALIDAAHAHGLAVILDVVYNHLGPDGNYLGAYSRDYFNPRHKTPWGDGFNFELQPVRDFFLENIGHWRREFHIDGFRLDATHAIEDGSEKHILAEISERAHSLGAFVIAEDERNEAALLQGCAEGGMGLDGIWSDDFHHIVRVMLTGGREGYYRAYHGTTDELSAALDHGWLLVGEERARQRVGEQGLGKRFEPHRFVFCITNHDQIGNQAFGLRMNQFVSGAAFRAASALLCLVPYTPLILMGQEWAASSPFLFFTDHEPELGRKVTEGRREEFRSFAAFRDPAAREKIPDPQAEETFLRSKLSWDELEREHHAGILRLYRELLRWRRTSAVLRDRSRQNFDVLTPVDDWVRFIYGKEKAERWLILANLTGQGGAMEPEGDWQLVLSTNDPRFGRDDERAARPEVRLYRDGNKDPET